ncbi:hypothetical protein [Streptacidiphilus anmyonensis]|uniref:hypothetical protein n=1 Tax=Streptacidiphilus anmyonensis TaxID=405782 RepID=UPI0005A5E340|nr:hypothetical protein [Streptacidiphilus anmyonensis]
MPCTTDVSFLLQIARDEKRPQPLAEAALALAFPDDDRVTDSAPAVIAAEVLDNAARGHVATRSALAAAALTGLEGAPAWAQSQIHPEGLPHAALLRALVVFTAQHLAERPAALRLLAHVLAPPMRAGR